MDKKVSLITRAYNRLEYTIKCIDSIKKTTNYDNYEHIIVNNNSSDGTKEWINWITESSIEFFKHVRGLHYDQNLGDWGGLLDASKYVAQDSEYFVQLDNDVEVLDPDWLHKMIYLLENTDHKIVQLKRGGVKTVINPSKLDKIYWNAEELIFGKIDRPVACFMLKTKDFKDLYPQLHNTGFYDGKTKLSRLLGGTVKLVTVRCNVMDVYTKEQYLNYEKYPANLSIGGKRVIQEMK